MDVRLVGEWFPAGQLAGTVLWCGKGEVSPPVLGTWESYPYQSTQEGEVILREAGRGRGRPSPGSIPHKDQGLRLARITDHRGR